MHPLACHRHCLIGSNYSNRHSATLSFSNSNQLSSLLSTLFLWGVQFDQVINAQDGQGSLGGKLQTKTNTASTR